jgi:predicted amidophosphoribosyltransferase
MSRRPPRRSEKPTQSLYAGVVTCLRCDHPFRSWDRRHNRLCPDCREAMERDVSDAPPPASPLLPHWRQHRDHD